MAKNLSLKETERQRAISDIACEAAKGTLYCVVTPTGNDINGNGKVMVTLKGYAEPSTRYTDSTFTSTITANVAGCWLTAKLAVAMGCKLNKRQQLVLPDHYTQNTYSGLVKVFADMGITWERVVYITND